MVSTRADKNSRMSVPPNILASVSIWTTVWLSARCNLRAPFIIGAAVIAIIGTPVVGTRNLSKNSYFETQVTLFYSLQRQVSFNGKLFTEDYNWQLRHGAGAQYVGVHFAAAGVYTGNALLLRLLFISRLMSCVLTLAYSWPGENVSGQTKRAVAVAMQITIGDIGAIAG